MDAIPVEEQLVIRRAYDKLEPPGREHTNPSIVDFHLHDNLLLDACDDFFHKRVAVWWEDGDGCRWEDGKVAGAT